VLGAFGTVKMAADIGRAFGIPTTRFTSFTIVRVSSECVSSKPFRASKKKA
jgi:hypothetical protein